VYLESRKAELGDFLGTVIGGIYEGIRKGKFDGASDFEHVAKRPHKSIDEMISDFLKDSGV
jgi:NAD(P)H dehydrogenase (quinone)